MAIFITMSKQRIDENSFEGGVGGSAGTLNYQTGYGTPASPDNQSPDHFESSNNNKAVNQNSNVAPSSVDSGSMSSQIDALYSDPKKARAITPDKVECGLKYVLGQQIKKDKREAKKEVVKQLLKDPDYYNGLHMLNITDKDMVNNMSENKQHPNDAPARTKVTPNVEETKKIFAEMMKGHDNKYVVNSQICDVMKQMWEQKKARRLGSQ